MGRFARANAPESGKTESKTPECPLNRLKKRNCHTRCDINAAGGCNFYWPARDRAYRDFARGEFLSGENRRESESCAAATGDPISPVLHLHFYLRSICVPSAWEIDVYRVGVLSILDAHGVNGRACHVKRDDH